MPMTFLRKANFPIGAFLGDAVFSPKPNVWTLSPNNATHTPRMSWLGPHDAMRSQKQYSPAGGKDEQTIALRII
jgi:hypothetical protein